MVLGPILQADGGERGHRPAAALGGRDRPIVRVEQRQLHVFDRGGARQQVESLEHEPDLAVANRRQLVVREVGDVTAVEQVASARRAVEAAEDVHERRLAGPGRPDDGDELAPADVEGDAAEGVHRRALHGVGLGDVVRGDQRRVARDHSVLRGVAVAGVGAGPFLPAKL